MVWFKTVQNVPIKMTTIMIPRLYGFPFSSTEFVTIDYLLHFKLDFVQKTIPD